LVTRSNKVRVHLMEDGPMEMGAQARASSSPSNSLPTRPPIRIL
jgi:hypothetical protein